MNDNVDFVITEDDWDENFDEVSKVLKRTVWSKDDEKVTIFSLP